MSLDVYDLYASASLSHTGTVDSGNGVGLRPPSPGLSQWQAYGTIPTGIREGFIDFWTSGSYFYALYNGLDGTGRGIYRYSVAADGTLTYDSYVTIAALGFAGGWPDMGAAQYDSVSDCVILVSYPTAGSGNVFCGKWDCANWPFSAANKAWHSTITQRYGTYLATEFHGRAIMFWDVPRSRLFLTSLNCGQVVTINTTDGSTAGNWIYWAFWGGTNPFVIFGVDSTGKVIGGSYHASGGDKDICLWNLANLNLWAIDSVVFLDSDNTVGVPHYKRAGKRLYAYRALAVPLGPAERTLLGCTSDELCFWWASYDPQYGYGEPRFCQYNASTGAFSDRLLVGSPNRRAAGNFNAFPFGYGFVSIGGIPWFVSRAWHTHDIENDNPGGAGTQQLGMVFMAVGPGTVKYSFTASDAMTPEKIVFEVDKAAKNYLHSEHGGKHRVRMRLDGGAWTAWRAGTQECNNLASAVNGKAAWSAITAGQAVEIEHGMCSGWPYNWDTMVLGNPGEVGDPTSEALSTPEVGPPREVVALLLYSGGAAVVHTIVGIDASVSLDPALAVSVEVG